MKKSLLSTLFLLILGMISVVYSYSPLSEQDHLQIDRQLQAFCSLSSAEKKEKSDFFSRLAQKSLAIRKAFLPIKMKLYGPQLNKDDQSFIDERVATLAHLPEKRRQEALADLKQVQYLSEELSRSLQIEASRDFQGYAKTIFPTPLFWLPVDQVDINKILGGKGTTGLKLNGNNLIMELAVVLPPETPLTLMKKIEKDGFTYYQVRTREFDAGRGAKVGYFVDARFIQKTDQKLAERTQTLPSFQEIKNNLLAASGTVYIWGGSWYQGIPEIDKLFPSDVQLSSLDQKRKLMQGVDCSGLLYQATNGYTPRNSRSLLTFWTGVAIEGKTAARLAKELKPLDLIVWDGHVVIVLDEKTTIESRGRGKNPGGVEFVPIEKRLKEIFESRSPVDEYSSSSLAKNKKFVVRRWL